MSLFDKICTLCILLITPVAAFDLTADSPEITAALELAGENKAEIQQLLSHYKLPGDSLKHRAALFLTANMEEQSYVTYRLFDTAGVDVELEVLSYPNYDSLLVDVTAIEKERGEIDYERVTTILDLETVTADYLINHIDLAFRAWQEKPWAQNIDFITFCRYILPYRGSNEPLEDWRQYFYEKYKGLEDSLQDSTDPLTAAAAINSDVRSWFGFDPRFYFHPTDQGLEEMMTNKLGRCEDMTNITIYALRANALAVTSDYTPHWANSGNNHAWNAIVDGNNNVIPFMGAECDPGKYKLANKVAKVYRKTYDIQKNNLIFQDNKQDKVPGWLARKNYADVTTAYTDVSNVTLQMMETPPDSIDFAYICVFNSGKWRPIHWGKLDGDLVTFNDMGTDIVYLVAYYLNEEVVPVTQPFILTKDKQVHMTYPNNKVSIDIEVSYSTNKTLVQSTDGVSEALLKPGLTYELRYWVNNDWQSFGAQTATDKPLVFKNIPNNCLLWLVDVDGSSEERIFTIMDGKQIWW